MRELFKFIPGFRSNSLWNKFLVALVLLIGVFALTSCESNPIQENTSTIANQTPVTEISTKVTTGNQEVENSTPTINKPDRTGKNQTEEQNKPEITKPSSPLKVHFIDVGQADSILIQNGSNIMLIDAGNNSDDQAIVDYIKKLNITKFDYVIGTHPHEDHIGGLDTVINNFKVDKIMMPKVSHNTKTFEDVLLAIKNKDLKVTTPITGADFELGDAKFTILAPNSDSYDNLNDYSVVLKLIHGNNSFLFTGDAEKISEDEVLRKYKDQLKSDVLKVGHHGSTTSSSPAFIKAVSPKHSIISVGKDNSYGHPDNIVLNRLKTYGEIYRTDQDGTIIATSDGEKITFEKIASSVKPQAPPAKAAAPKPAPVVKPEPKADKEESRSVYITKTGSKYHLSGCSSLSKSKIPISLEQAKSGYGPCKRCNPPY